MRISDDLTDSESQSRLYSSQSDTEAVSNDEHKSRYTRTQGRELDQLPKLIDTISLCYLAAIIIQMPVSLGDLQKWVNNGDMLYYSAIREIPHQMLLKLPGEYHQPLQPSVILRADDLHLAVSALAIAYEREFNMEFAPINYPPLLFYFIRSLALPFEIYAEVKILASIVSYDFRLPSNKSSAILHPKDFPEAQLIALLIIAVKLSYPFENIKRHPRTADEAATTAVNWNAWVEALQSYKSALETPKRLSYKECLEVTEDTIFGLNDQQVDDYLDWYNQEFSSRKVNEQNNDFRKALFDIFPSTNRTSATVTASLDQASIELAISNRINKVQMSLQSRIVTANSQDMRNTACPVSGSTYQMICKCDELEGHMKVFMEECAELVGMSISRLLRAVFYTEKKLESWVKGKIKNDL